MKKAIGFSLERSDEVSVANMPFEVTAEEIPVEKRDYAALGMQSLKYLAPFIVVVLFFLMVLRPIMRALTGEREPEGGAQIRALAAAHAQQSLSLEPILPELESDTKTRGVKGQVLDWVEKNPKKTADLIRGWLEEKK